MVEARLVDRLNKVEIEQALGLLLPECEIQCTLNVDGTASLMVKGMRGEGFAVTGLIRTDYQGKPGLKRLAMHIFEDIELARQGM